MTSATQINYEPTRPSIASALSSVIERMLALVASDAELKGNLRLLARTFLEEAQEAETQD